MPHQAGWQYNWKHIRCLITCWIIQYMVGWLETIIVGCHYVFDINPINNNSNKKHEFTKIQQPNIGSREQKGRAHVSSQKQQFCMDTGGGPWLRLMFMRIFEFITWKDTPQNGEKYGLYEWQDKMPTWRWPVPWIQQPEKQTNYMSRISPHLKTKTKQILKFSD